MSGITDLQNYVLGPSQGVNYSDLVMRNYPPQAIQTQPFIGFKVLCMDSNMSPMPASMRVAQIDNTLRGIMYNSNCFMRETSNIVNNGYWVVTLPVPRGYLATQVSKLMDVLAKLDVLLGIRPTGLVEVNVSGRCNQASIESCLQKLVIPHPYSAMLEVPDNTPYRYGTIIRINDEYICYRSRWTLTKLDGRLTPTIMYEHLSLLAQLLCSMYY